MSIPYLEPTINLKQGSKGDGVRWLQWSLNQNGANLAVDGDFGKLTNEAVLKFQKDNPPLKIDGIVGPLTREKLKSKLKTEISEEIDIRAGQNITLMAQDSITLMAHRSITLVVGGSTLIMDADGTIKLDGNNIILRGKTIKEN